MTDREMTKGPQAFRTISEASSELGVPQHVLRFWETKFSFIRPMKRAGGRRFYRPQDLDVLKGVRVLLHEGGYTIKGVQRLHKEAGVRRLIGAGEGDLPPPAARTLSAADLVCEPEVAVAPLLLADADNSAAKSSSPPLAAHIAPDTAILQAPARARLEAVLRDLEQAKAGVDRLLWESDA